MVGGSCLKAYPAFLSRTFILERQEIGRRQLDTVVLHIR
jgi:hypothetical protein